MRRVISVEGICQVGVDAVIEVDLSATMVEDEHCFSGESGHWVISIDSSHVGVGDFAVLEVSEVHVAHSGSAICEQSYIEALQSVVQSSEDGNGASKTMSSHNDLSLYEYLEESLTSWCLGTI
jgi:hypothetical protein